VLNYVLFYPTIVCHLTISNIPQNASMPQVVNSWFRPIFTLETNFSEQLNPQLVFTLNAYPELLKVKIKPYGRDKFVL